MRSQQESSWHTTQIRVNPHHRAGSNRREQDLAAENLGLGRKSAIAGADSRLDRHLTSETQHLPESVRERAKNAMKALVAEGLTSEELSELKFDHFGEDYSTLTLPKGSIIRISDLCGAAIAMYDCVCRDLSKRSQSKMPDKMFGEWPAYVLEFEKSPEAEASNIDPATAPDMPVLSTDTPTTTAAL